MKSYAKTFIAVITAAFCFNSYANENFSIMNDRLGSAIEDNANNNNVSTRVNDAYNAAKGAINGSMDTSQSVGNTNNASSSISQINDKMDALGRSTLSASQQRALDARNAAYGVNHAAYNAAQAKIDAMNAKPSSVKTGVYSTGPATLASQPSTVGQPVGTTQTIASSTGDAISTSTLSTAPQFKRDFTQATPTAGVATNVATSPAQAAISTGTAYRVGVNIAQANIAVVNTVDAAQMKSAAIASAGALVNTVDAGAMKSASIAAQQTIAVNQQADMNSSINVAASSLAPSTPVNTTINGVNVTTTAGDIAQDNPTAQITVGLVSPFAPAVHHSGSDRSKNNSHAEHGAARGADNAHSHAFGGHGYGHDNSKSEGFGGHSHFH